MVVNKNKVRPKSKSKLKRKNKFTCPYCGKGFVQRSKYIVHKSFHKTLKYECMDCKKQFSTKENLSTHQKVDSHLGEKIVAINDKENILKDSPDESEKTDLLDTHELSESDPISTDVQNEPGFITDEENDNNTNNVANENIDIFDSTNEIQDLTSKEFSDSLQCDRCHKHFQSKNNLETHVKVVHLGEKPFICEICNKAFAYQSSLKGHQEIVHQVNLFLFCLNLLKIKKKIHFKNVFLFFLNSFFIYH